MADVYPPPKPRAALLALAAALDSRAVALGRDECGDWRIDGRHGHIYAVPGILDRPNTEGFLLYAAACSPRAWAYTKRDLAFAELMQDGDDEGCLFLDRLPTAAEAAILRDRLGIAKKRVLSESQLQKLREAGTGGRFRPNFSPSAPSPLSLYSEGSQGENSAPSPLFDAGCRTMGGAG